MGGPGPLTSLPSRTSVPWLQVVGGGGTGGGGRPWHPPSEDPRLPPLDSASGFGGLCIRQALLQWLPEKARTSVSKCLDFISFDTVWESRGRR